MRDWYCEYLRFNKLQHNCKLRRNEGYMINRSLGDMRTDIQLLIKKSLALSEDRKDLLPLFYEKDIYPYCRNVNIDDEYFDDFYNLDSESKLAGVLLKIMGDKGEREFGLDMSSINFVVFTVINLTNNGRVNNPPGPPFLNTNQVVYYSKINFDYDKLKESIINILAEASQYNFYKNSNAMQELFKREDYMGSYDHQQMKDFGNSIVNVINANNPSTLIGSLISTDILQNTVFNKTVCSLNSNLESLLTKYKTKPLDSHISAKSIEEIKQIIDDPNKKF